MRHFESIQTRLILLVIGLVFGIVSFYSVFSYWQLRGGLIETLQTEGTTIVSDFHALMA